MRIALLAAAASIHTVRWANGLNAAGHEVHVISQHPIVDPFEPAVQVHLFPDRGSLGYFTMAPTVRRLLKRIQPNIVNAHYASGYGTTARLVNYRPFVLSVWGSDVYDFPFKSPLHSWLIKKNLRAADQLASTSQCMANQTRTLAPELDDISITPFGVDLSEYQEITPVSAEKQSKLVIGTVKTMRPKYGIDTLIEAFALLVKNLGMNSTSPELPELELRLVGGGDQSADLQALAQQLGIADKVNFVGRVPHRRVPQELAKLDVYVALSRYDSESFGVAIIEASAAGKPVIVSDAGGLPEVTIDGQTGLVVPCENPEAAAEAMERLVFDAELRHAMGSAGQLHVAKHYAWDVCIETMLGVYEKTLKSNRVK